ncbi:pumilio homolog 5 isoform X1 [Musa acuminata AAA Group]|uniref:pumilio homolog 5 isoform X1 n=1 Tax=Musa acuminata AAA Group TaxID=214697 RepID=UPI0031DDE636
MATENPLRFIGNNGAGNWTLNKDTSQFASSDNIVSEELGSLLKGQRFHGNNSITGLSRSGSAPPSMEGSRAAFDILEDRTADLDGSLENLSNAAQNCNSEEQLCAHPAYLAYYCSNVNLNPRLPPPLISRENRHLMQHNSGFEDNRRMPSFDDSNKASFFVSRPALSTHDEEPEDDRSPRVEHTDWMKADVVSGHFTPSPGHLAQKDFPQTSSPVYADHSHPSSHIMLEQAPNQDAFLNPLQESSMGITEPETRSPSIAANACIPHLGSHSVQSMLNDNLGGTPVTCSASTDKTVNLHQGCGNIEDDLKNLRLSSDGHRRHQPQQYMQQVGIYPQSSSSHAQIGQSQVIVQGHYPQSTGDRFSHGQPKLPSVEVQPLLQSSGIAPLYVTAAAFGTPYYHNLQSSSLLPSQFGISGYALNPSLVPPLVTAYPHHRSGIPVPFENAVGPNFSARASGVSDGGNVSGIDMQHLHKIYGQLGLAIQPPFPDPLYVPFYNYPSLDAYAAAGQYDPTISRGGSVGSSPGTYDPQKAPGPAHLPDQRPQVMRVGGVNTLNLNAITGGAGSPSYYGSSPNNSVLMQFPSSSLASPVFQGSTVAGTSFSGRKNDNIKFPFGSERNAGSLSGWQNQRGREKVDEPKSYSFLEELKSNRARRYELSDIAGHIVEFSADQHGSRFIQQKLETCSVDEKASVFKEVLPHASSLMTDVFGNYVIQKFFEHGSPEQRRELANKLVGNVLPLSLQMYGCRVIQKALEVIELDQKTQLVQELDGNVMRCVRDQNGNHVIQKCIECIPTEKIGFIISAFHGQIATLSTHPYGCRVIQRVLEHCTDESQSQWIVDEILQSACLLAQDQYGNYVTQHVLEREKPHERSQIISKLSGQIVQMSQHKFASNVIEKCLEYGNTEERDHLIKEILGQTEGNDNLLVMMKDQFANYVVQKSLETCTDNQRQILLDRIKVHLQALKKYTYGKHIVARVEQLCSEVQIFRNHEM